MKATVEQQFVEFQTLVMKTESNGLTILFDYSNKPEHEVPDCGRIILKNCPEDALAEISEIVFEWVNCQKFVSPIDEITITPTNENVTVLIAPELLNSVNDYYIYGVISTVRTLLGRGRIYIT